VVHISAAVGAEAGDDGTERAFSARGMSACVRTQDRLGQFRSNAFSSLGNLVERAANADGLIDGGSCASAKAAQYHAERTDGVVYGAPAGTARALGHFDFISEVTIAVNVDAVEPRRIEVLTCLHVESDGDGIFLAPGIARRCAAVAAAEIHGHALARYADEPAVKGAITVTIAILIGVLRPRERGARNQTQNRDNKEWGELCRHISQESDGVIPPSARRIGHRTPLN